MHSSEMLSALKVMATDIAALKQLYDQEKKTIWKVWQEENPNASTAERFFFWAYNELGSKNYDYIHHFVSKRGKELFGYGNLIESDYRGTVYAIDHVAEILDSHIDKDDQLKWAKYKEITIDDINDWKEELIKTDYQSMVWDW